MWSFINVRKDGPKISDLNKTGVSEPNISEINAKLE